MRGARLRVVTLGLVVGFVSVVGASAQPQFDEVSRVKLGDNVKSFDVASDDSVMLRECRTGSSAGPGAHRPYHARIGALGRHAGVQGMWLPQRHVGAGARYDVIAFHSGCSGYMLVHAEEKRVASNAPAVGAGNAQRAEQLPDGEDSAEKPPERCDCDCERCSDEERPLEEDQEGDEQSVTTYSLLLWPILVYEGSGAGSEGTSFFVEFVENPQAGTRLMRVMLLPDQNDVGRVWVQADGRAAPRREGDAEIVWLEKPFEWVEVRYDGRGGVDIGKVQSTNGGAFGRLARQARADHLSRPPGEWEPGCWRP